MDSSEAALDRQARARTGGERNAWVGVEVRHLAALRAVAREGSFRGAADALGYVQSAVSQQIAHLERVVGRRLVKRQRGSGPAALTPAGELLLEHACGILSSFGAAQADMEALSMGCPRLRIGACSSLANSLLPRVVPALLERMSELRLEVVERTPSALAEQVARGSLEVAFAELPLSEGPFRATTLGRDPYVLLAARGAVPAEHAQEIAPEELAGLPLIDHTLAAPAEERLLAAGIAAQYTLRCESAAVLRSLIAGGAGFAIAPALSIEPLDDRIEAVSLEHLLTPRHVCAFWHEQRRPPAALKPLLGLARGCCGGDEQVSPPLRAAA
jgi:molybdate transport repressor ModE-like protein